MHESVRLFAEIRRGEAVDIVSGEGDQTDARNIILGASYLFGLPGYQVWRTISGIDAASRGEAGPQAIVLGPPRK